MQALTSAVFNVYLAIVCAFSLLAATIFAGAGLNGLAGLFFSAPIEVTQTQYDDIVKKELPRDPLIIQHEKEERAQTQRYYTAHGMLESFVYFFLTAVMFTVHWRLFRRRVALADLFLKEKMPILPTTKPAKKAK